MIDFLQIAEKRLERLEAAWLVAMSFGTLMAIEFGIVIENAGQVSDSSIISILLFLLLGILATPLAILILLPCWNFITPIQDRMTIWETELVVFTTTVIGLTISSAYFFDIPYGVAIKTPLFLAITLLPILLMTAKYRWHVEIAEIRRQVMKPIPTIHSQYEKDGQPTDTINITFIDEP